MTAPRPVFVVEGEVLPPGPTAVPDAAPEVVELGCDLCAETFTGPPGGKGSAPMLLGRHRYAVHGISKRTTGKRAPAREQATAVDLERHPVIGAVHEAAGQVKGTGVPKALDLSRALGRGLNIATLMGAGWAVDSDPLIAAQSGPEAADRRNALVQALSLSAESAERIAAPFGRLIAPTSLNQKFGRSFVDNTDLGPAMVEVVEVVRTWREFLSIRRQHVAELRAAREAAAGSTPYTAPTPAAQEAAAAAPAPAPAPTASGVPLGSGRVATPSYRTT